MLLRRNSQGDLKVQGRLSPKRDSDRAGLAREFYTVSQLADLLQLTEMTIYRMVNRAELPCYAIGRVKRFRHRDIEEFLDSCRIPAAKAAGPQVQTEHRLKVRGSPRLRPRGSKAGPVATPTPDFELPDN